AASDAKAALLQAYLAAKDAAEPTWAARQSQRAAMATTKENRRLERHRAKVEEQERVRAEAAEQQAAADTAAKAELEAREAADRDRIARVVEDEAARKVARDLRYANRKA